MQPPAESAKAESYSRQWLLPPSHLSLDGHQVHVWRAILSQPEQTRARLLSLLSPDETRRMARFLSQGHQHRFGTGRGIVRDILARYLQAEPGSLEFAYAEKGKPRLNSLSSIHFNAAHTGDFLLVAVTLASEIGVDIERLRQMKDMDAIARRFFTPREYAAFRQVKEESRRESFFLCWTRKEAVLKAVGAGIPSGLDQFDVSLAPDAPAALLENRLPEENARGLKLSHLSPWPECVGAVAAAWTELDLRCWTWTDSSPGAAQGCQPPALPPQFLRNE